MNVATDYSSLQVYSLDFLTFWEDCHFLIPFWSSPENWIMDFCPQGPVLIMSTLLLTNWTLNDSQIWEVYWKERRVSWFPWFLGGMVSLCPRSDEAEWMTRFSVCLLQGRPAVFHYCWDKQSSTTNPAFLENSLFSVV